MISEKAIIFPDVKLGKNCIVEDYSIIGVPPQGHDAKEFQTIIGDNAIVRSHTVIYAGNKIGDNFQTGNKANIRELNEIGNNVSIGTLSVVEHHVKIGNNVRIHTQAFIPELTILDDGCWIGPNVVITNAKYPQSPTAKADLKGVHIMEKAIIGANSTLLPGIKVGRHALIGAGSVVMRDVEPDNVVAGNPAEVIKKTSHIKEYQ